MKYLLGAQAPEQRGNKVRDQQPQVANAKDDDSANSSQNNVQLRKKVKKKSPAENKRGKGSITTRGDAMTRMSSKCPSNFSLAKASHRFERLKKEVAVKNEAGRCVPITTDYEILRFRGHDRKTNYRFYCFRDELLEIPPTLRACLRSASVDFDVQSTDGQIETSVQKLTRNLKQAIEERNKASAAERERNV